MENNQRTVQIFPVTKRPCLGNGPARSGVSALPPVGLTVVMCCQNGLC